MNTTELIYLDHAAATPVDERVVAAMQPYLTEKFFNPSSPYAAAVEVRRDYEAAKHGIAKIIGVQKDELIMTAGATESINLAFSAAGNGHVVTSEIEHASVLMRANQFSHTLISPTEKGIVTAEAIAKALTPETTFVSIALANNELGTIQPIRQIAQVIETERARRSEAGEKTPLYFHADGSQAAGSLDLHVNKLGLDLLTLSAGKIYGPKQVGLLWAAPSVDLRPEIVGGGQERGLRSGTENVAGVIGFAKALELVTTHQKTESKRLGELRDKVQSRLEEHFPDMLVLGSAKKRLAHFLTVAFPALDAERIIFAAETRGLCVATGSACAANSGTRSHVLVAIGLEPDIADGSLRLSFGRLSNEENSQKAVEILIEIIDAERARSHR